MLHGLPAPRIPTGASCPTPCTAFHESLMGMIGHGLEEFGSHTRSSRKCRDDSQEQEAGFCVRGMISYKVLTEQTLKRRQASHGVCKRPSWG